MPVFGTASKKQLARALPAMQKLLNAAIKEVDFKILESTRGRHAQEKAVLTGHSKVHFGNSAHNYEPSVAVDLFPAPYIWPDDKTKTAAQRQQAQKAFEHLYAVMSRIAKEQGIKIRCGIDFNMDGSRTTNDSWDAGHYELHPWRDWAKKSKLFED